MSTIVNKVKDAPRVMVLNDVLPNIDVDVDTLDVFQLLKSKDVRLEQL